LFGDPEESSCSLDETRIDDIPHVSPDENSLLTSPYMEEEVNKTFFQMEHNKAPGPDSFPAEFYQYFWEIIKGDLMELFGCLHTGQLELFQINFGEIILLPKFTKRKGFNNLDRYAFLNVCFNFLRKLRLSPYSDDIHAR
jgi:hypothetical protein